MALLELSRVTHAYDTAHGFLRKSKQGPQTVVKDVSITLEAGECIGLLGGSGAGKSTLGKIMLGLQRPQSGSVLIQGKDMYTSDKRTKKQLRKHVQAVFQDCYSSVNSRMTAAQIISEPLDNFERLTTKEKTYRICEALDLVGLPTTVMNKLPKEFSGGQLQRINIARAMISNPSFIVLDEAVSSLDVANQVHIISVLRDLKAQRDMSYIFITHNLKAAFALCDRWTVLDKGNLCGSFSTKAEMKASEESAVKQLLDASLSKRPELGTIRKDRYFLHDTEQREDAGA
ncbi:ATP-binding cassette domain-containing protein [Paenibacillus taichungensis]|uniref:Nickel import ATP-binding protein NikE n=1 Tax=Paenibacillus taichungensis TaxID=484184 RepID=A0A329QC20_9BACL|nr:ATP-binding cassette domain-containing protein [Paenibacillus taichungensis]RAW09923.1 nickel import ATP-binding protein NikE [Paenibacillus taichungensis]